MRLNVSIFLDGYLERDVIMGGFNVSSSLSGCILPSCRLEATEMHENIVAVVLPTPIDELPLLLRESGRHVLFETMGSSRSG